MKPAPVVVTHRMKNISFFECSFAREGSFASPIGLRADALPSSDRGIRIQIATIAQHGPSQATTGMKLQHNVCILPCTICVL